MQKQNFACFFSAKKIVWLFHAKTKFCVFFRGTMSVIISFVVQLVLYVSKRNSAVRFSQIETKRSYLTIGKAQLNACAVSDGVEEQKSCLGLGDIKTVITFPLYNFLIPNLAGCFVTAIATVCDFYIFPIVGIGAINFQIKKQAIHPCFRVFLSPKVVEKLFDLDFHKLHNMTNVCVQNLCFYRARFSIQSLLKTTPCPLKRQRENHPVF